MNLYIIILKGVLCFFLPTVEKLRTQKLQKKKDLVSEERPEQNLRFRPSKKRKTREENRKKKRVTSIFTLFSLSLCNSALDALFKDEFHARKRHIFVAVVVL